MSDQQRLESEHLQARDVLFALVGAASEYYRTRAALIASRQKQQQEQQPEQPQE